MLSSTNPVERLAEFIQLILMVQVPLMYIVTRPQPVEAGQSSRRELMVPLILTEPGMTTNLVGEFWLGLDKINRLTQNKTKNKLRVDLRAITNKIVHPEYDWFGIATETNKYRLYIGKMTTSKSSINQFFSHIVRIISLLPLHRQRVLLAPFPLILLLATNKECFFPALYRLAMFSSESHSAHAQLSPHPSVENGNLLSRLLESDSLDILRKSKL